MRVKDLYIQIPKYNFSGKKLKKHEFLGRTEVEEKLRRRLLPNVKEDSGIYNGAYLIAGYRGMGKSTLVKKVINDINDFIKESDDSSENIQVLNIEVFLSQGSLSDYDLLRQMFVQLENKLDEKFRLRFLERNIAIRAAVLSCIFSLPYLVFEWLGKIGNSDVLAFLIFLIIFLLFFNIIKFLLSKYYKRKLKLARKLNEIKQRVHSDFELSYGGSDGDISLASVASEVKLPSSLIMGKLNKGSSKQMFQKFTTKELEFELKDILELLYKKPNSNSPSTDNISKTKIVFTVDELDKLEPEYGDGVRHQINTGKSDIDSRKETINALLANLKSFINTAYAKFIFIGGAEMYEASLADIADRESFYSSIFDEVFYVNSFFKDKVYGTHRNITQMVDSYLLKNVLFDGNIRESHFKTDYPNYSKFYQRLENANNEKSLKNLVLYLVNRYLIYLTYRSNGSPKKLKMLLEDNIIQIREGQGNDHIDRNRKIRPDSIILNTTEKAGYLISSSSRSNFYKSLKPKPGYYLQIKYNLQYKSNLHTSIFLPFLIKNEHHLKEFNDKSLYLSAFLMDHILKFHKSAFSWRELEMIPDIIIGSKGPSLRDTMDEIINYLSIKHVRETTNAMFQYKFRSRIALELKYISKISNESAAAFNFTYDESQHLKTFFKRKLKQKIENYKDDKSIVTDSFIHSLTYLNSIIAEIHFYDEDYGSAIRYYSDAIQALRSLNKIENNHQKILFTRYSLLLSLCLEKSKNYDSTYSILRSTLIDIGRLDFKELENSIISKQWEQPYKRMQLFLRPHLSLLMVIEKERSDGITVSNLERNIKEYCEFMGLVNLFPYVDFNSKLDFRGMVKNDKKGDHKRIQTLLADYYQSVGAILFYKNRNFLKLYEKGAKGILFKHLGIQRLNIKDENLNDKVPYLCLDKVRDFFAIDHGHYYPSFSSFFYYSTSLGHLLLPFVENLQAIFESTFPQRKISEIKLSDKMFMLEHLAFDNKALHILGGKQKELIALILSKLADSILSCIGSRTDCGFQIRKENPNFNLFIDKGFNYTENWAHCEISSFEELFDITTVLYFNILSSKFYHAADKYYDSYFALKKCIYILITHKSLWKNEVKEDLEKTSGNNCVEVSNDTFLFLTNLTDWLFSNCEEIISTYSISPKLSEENFFNNVTEDIFSPAYILNSEDETELKILKDKYAVIKARGESDSEINSMLQRRLNDSIHTIGSIFSRAQQLKFQTELIYAGHKIYIDRLFELDVLSDIKQTGGQIEFYAYDDDNCKSESKSVEIPFENFFYYGHEMIFCYKNLISIINTYGIGYTMSNSYIASIYKNLAKWSKVLEIIDKCIKSFTKSHRHEINNSEIQSNLINQFEILLEERSHLFNTIKNKNKAIEYYEKALSLHSEGAEYKRVIKDMYMLEDDFNDGLIHFYASLERSLLNSGIISKRITRLKN